MDWESSDRSEDARHQERFGTRAPRTFCARLIKLVFPVLLVVPGLLAVALYGGELGAPDAGFDANQVLPLMVVRLVPKGALGLLMGAFVAGVMANLDSYINSASTLLVNDLYRPFIDPEASDARCLFLGRAAVVGLLAGGVLVSYEVKTRFASVFEAFQTFLSFFQGALFAVLLFGMLSRRATPLGGVFGMAAGVAAAAVTQQTGPERARAASRTAGSAGDILLNHLCADDTMVAVTCGSLSGAAGSRMVRH